METASRTAVTLKEHMNAFVKMDISLDKIAKHVKMLMNACWIMEAVNTSVSTLKAHTNVPVEMAFI